MKEIQPQLPQMPEPEKKDPYVITEMPDKETLEDFLRGMSKNPVVVYNSEKGIFERIDV